MSTAKVIFMAMVALVVLGAALREVCHGLLSEDGYEYATLVLVIAGLGVTIAGLDGLAHL
jgi:hypothetical protein